ncbi:MAG: metal-sensitive transcriptional regulator [Kiritimatiellia bacterium]|nr:metal-sensitive transcriptional regulator [Kiritimatiellia bacterium]
MKTQKTTHLETLRRLARIAGHFQCIGRMVEEEKYCIDIITQVQAARAALRSVEMEILRKHIRHCVTNAMTRGSNAEVDRKMTELLHALQKQY